MPVAGIIRVPLVMEVNPSFPAKTVPEFIALCQGQSRQDQHGVGWERDHAACLRRAFKMMTDVKMVHVPYRGAGPALIDLVGGQVQVMFDAVPRRSSTSELASCARLRYDGNSLGGAARRAAVGDFVPGYEVSTGMGSALPRARRPRSLRSSTEINAGLVDPAIKARLADLGQWPFALARRLRQAYRRRNREVGQGDQVRGHQAGVTRDPDRLFRNARSAKRRASPALPK